MLPEKLLVKPANAIVPVLTTIAPLSTISTIDRADADAAGLFEDGAGHVDKARIERGAAVYVDIGCELVDPALLIDETGRVEGRVAELQEKSLSDRAKILPDDTTADEEPADIGAAALSGDERAAARERRGGVGGAEAVAARQRQRRPVEVEGRSVTRAKLWEVLRFSLSVATVLGSVIAVATATVVPGLIVSLLPKPR
jgi:hypothetical protein